MNHSRSVDFVPFLTFFASGRFSIGFLTMLMQMSLFLWPTATRWAREAREQENVQKLLKELSETHRPPLASASKVAYPEITKKFRQPA